MPHLTDIRDLVDRLVDDALEDTNLFRVESTVTGNARSPVISVYVDGDEGISIGQCASLSRDLHRSIEDADVCPGGFGLNVSSPGLDRSLVLPRQYARHVGRDVRLKIARDETQEAVEGRLLGASRDAVRIESEAGEIALPFASIEEAVVKVAW